MLVNLVHLTAVIKDEKLKIRVFGQMASLN